MDDLNLNLDDLLSAPLEFTEIENLLKRLQGGFEAIKLGRGTPQEKVQSFKKEAINQLQETNKAVTDEMVFSPGWNNRPPVVVPTITWAGIPILEVGNVSMITAGAGTGKSTVCETHCSAFLNPGCDSFGIQVHTPKILYLDTEQSNPHSWASWERCMRRAGLPNDKTPDQLLWDNIRGIPTPAQKQDLLFSYLTKLPETSLIILDGIGDLVTDVNNTEAVVDLMTRLCAELHTRNMACLVTLHNNPSTNTLKARGVLGSELWRRCQAVAVVERLDNDVRVLKTSYGLGKNRAGDAVSVSFKWDPEKRYHTSSNEPVVAVPNKLVTQRNQILHAMGDKSWAYSDLVTMIMQDSGKSQPTAERYIRDLLKIKKIKKNGSGDYRACSDPGPTIQSIGLDFESDPVIFGDEEPSN